MTRSGLLLSFSLLVGLPATGIASNPGTLDPTFDGDGIVTTSMGTDVDEVEDLAIQDDGKIVVVGTVNNGAVDNFGVARYDSNGALDSGFDGDGKVLTSIGLLSVSYGVALQDDGKIVVVGTATPGGSFQFAVVRYNADGSLDTSFDGDGIVLTDISADHDQARAVAIQADGKIVVAGLTYPNSGSDSAESVARYNTDGSLDTSFGVGGIVTSAPSALKGGIEDVAIQEDGRIVGVGRLDSDLTVWRYDSNGSLDGKFGDGGLAPIPAVLSFSIAYSVAIQKDGKIVAAGVGVAATGDAVVLRLKTDGSPDDTFGGDGVVVLPIGSESDGAYGVALQNDGRILLTGYTYDTGFGSVFVARLDPAGVPDVTFDGDGIVITTLGGTSSGVKVAVQQDGKIVAAGWTENADFDFVVLRYGSSLCDTLDPIPPGSCITGAKLSLQVKRSDTAKKNGIKWSIKNGEALAQIDLGNPVASTAYALCIYDSTASTTRLATAVDIAPGALWTDRTPDGLSYKDKVGVSGGLKKLQIKTGGAGESKVNLKAGGVFTPAPVPFSAVELFDQDTTVTAQLISSTGLCLTSSFTTATINDGTQFKEKLP